MNLLPTFASTHRDIAPLVGRVHHADIFALCDRLPDTSVDMILCDLPYGVTALKDTWDVVIPFAPMWAAFKRVIKPRGAIVLTASQPFTSKLVCSNLEMFRYEWIWNKNNSAGFALAPFRPFIIHESVLVFSIEAANYYPLMEIRGLPRSKDGYSKSEAYGIQPSKTGELSNTYYPKSILNFGNADQTDKQHPTQKPVALFEYLIKTYTQPGELVFDPCAGSGTTAVAARNTGREFIVGDLTHEYVLIARDRLNTEFGVKHTRKETDLAGLPLFAMGHP